MQAARFTLIGDCLYRKSFGGLYLKCLNGTEAQYGKTIWRYMWQSHRRSNLSTSCSFTRILLAHHETRCCKLCQNVWSVPKARPHSPHAFWEPKSGHKPLAIYVIGNGHSWPLPVAATQKKFLLLATNYFSKWVKAKAYSNIKDKVVFKSFWKNIIYRFRIP